MHRVHSLIPRTGQRAALAALASGLAVGLAPVSGCSQTTVTRDSITTIDALGIEEWNAFAQEMVNSMVSSGVLDRYRGPYNEPVVIAIGDFRNKTTRAAFTRERETMYNSIQTAIINSGKGVVNRDVAGTGGDVEGLLGDLADLRDSAEYDQGTVTPPGQALAPRLVLSGEFINIEQSAGRTRQVDYQISCEMIDARTRTSVWIGTFDLSKQYKRGVFGG